MSDYEYTTKLRAELARHVDPLILHVDDVAELYGETSCARSFEVTVWSVNRREVWCFPASGEHLPEVTAFASDILGVFETLERLPPGEELLPGMPRCGADVLQDRQLNHRFRSGSFRLDERPPEKTLLKVHLTGDLIYLGAVWGGHDQCGLELRRVDVADPAEVARGYYTRGIDKQVPRVKLPLSVEAARASAHLLQERVRVDVTIFPAIVMTPYQRSDRAQVRFVAARRNDGFGTMKFRFAPQSGERSTPAFALPFLSSQLWRDPDEHGNGAHNTLLCPDLLTHFGERVDQHVELWPLTYPTRVNPASQRGVWHFGGSQ